MWWYVYIILLKNLTLRKRDQDARTVFVSIMGGGGQIDMERIDSQHFTDCQSLIVGGVGWGWELCSPTISVRSMALHLVVQKFRITCLDCYDLCIHWQVQRAAIRQGQYMCIWTWGNGMTNSENHAMVSRTLTFQVYTVYLLTEQEKSLQYRTSEKEQFSKVYTLGLLLQMSRLYLIQGHDFKLVGLHISQMEIKLRWSQQFKRSPKCKDYFVNYISVLDMYWK